MAHLLVLRADRRWQAAERSDLSAPQPDAASATEPAPDGASIALGARSFRREDLAALATSAAFGASTNTPGAVIVIDGGNGSLGAGLLAALHEALPGVVLWPIGLNPNAQATMLDALGDAAPPIIPPDALARSAVIIGSGDLLLLGGLEGEVNAELLADLAASPAADTATSSRLAAALGGRARVAGRALDRERRDRGEQRGTLGRTRRSMHSLIVSQDGTFRTDLDPRALDTALGVPTNVIWLDIQDPTEEDTVLLRDVFDFHPLAIEDAVRSHERPKVDAYTASTGHRIGNRVQTLLHEMEVLHQDFHPDEVVEPTRKP
jgi:hypothetical protein